MVTVSMGSKISGFINHMEKAQMYFNKLGVAKTLIHSG